jgi:hypothetical protein
MERPLGDPLGDEVSFPLSRVEFPVRHDSSIRSRVRLLASRARENEGVQGAMARSPHRTEAELEPSFSTSGRSVSAAAGLEPHFTVAERLPV